MAKETPIRKGPFSLPLDFLSIQTVLRRKKRESKKDSFATIKNRPHFLNCPLFLDLFGEKEEKEKKKI